MQSFSQFFCESVQWVKYYHGTAQRFKRSILLRGLRAGSYVSQEKFVAQGFAEAMFEDEPIAMVTISLPDNQVTKYLDNEVESTAEVIQVIPPQFLI